MRRRGELRLIGQAIRRGWPITDKGRSDAMALVSEVLDDEDATPRERLAAANVVLLMASANMLDDEDAVLLETVKRIGRQLDEEARR